MDGKAQSFGAHFKARNQFSSDIALAFPKEAWIKTCIRNYTLEENSMRTEDRFELKTMTAPDTLHFLVWARPVPAKEGQFIPEKEGTRLRFNYDEKIFSYTIDSIPQTDKRLSNVWGDQVYRIRLTPKKCSSKAATRYSSERNDHLRKAALNSLTCSSLIGTSCPRLADMISDFALNSATSR